MHFKLKILTTLGCVNKNLYTQNKLLFKDEEDMRSIKTKFNHEKNIAFIINYLLAERLR